jgi:hypothetical protein
MDWSSEYALDSSWHARMHGVPCAWRQEEVRGGGKEDTNGAV